MTGQIVVGDATEAVNSLGSWNFSAEQTTISPARVSRGLINVQYISIDDRLFTGNVKLRAGSNIELNVQTETVDGQTETTITVSATLNAGSVLQLNNDQDILDRIIQEYGVPIQSINGLIPDSSRNFNLYGEDCVSISEVANGLVFSNPCSAPCCEEDPNITSLMDSVANQNLRYAQLKAFFDGLSTAVNNLQNKLLVLGSEI